MGKPAARITDPTAHGGMITGPGIPTVLIGKLPAATLGDMHVCPVPFPNPHVGGPILLGSTGVFIGKKPAARLGDMAACAGPPDVILGGCPTVLIGEIGAGSSAAGAASAAAVSASSLAPPQGTEPFDFGPQESPPAEQHEMIFQAEDAAGQPLGGQLYEATDPRSQTLRAGTFQENPTVHGGYTAAGSYEVRFKALENLTLAPTKASPGKPFQVKLSAPGFEDGERVGVSLVFITLKTEVHAATVAATVSGEKAAVEIPWPEGVLEALEGDAVQGAYALAAIGAWAAVSEPVEVRADLKGYLQYKGMRIKNLALSLALPDSEILEGRSNGQGSFTFRDVPAGWAEVQVETVVGPRRFPVCTEFENPCLIRPRLTVRKLAEKLKAIEAEKGYEEALRSVWALNYPEISKLALRFGEEPEVYPDDDPNLMPSRFMILPGAEDEKLKAKGNLDKWPYSLESEDKLEMSVKILAETLGKMGFRPIEEEFRWHGDLDLAVMSYLTSKPSSENKAPEGKIHRVRKGESLSIIAKSYGIPKWERIYEMNQEVIGDNPNLIHPGMELQLPQTSSPLIQDWFLDEGYDMKFLWGRCWTYPNPDGEILDAYFMDSEGSKVEITTLGVPLYLVLETVLMEGKKIEVDLEKSKFIFDWDGKKGDSQCIHNYHVTESRTRIPITAVSRKRP